MKKTYLWLFSIAVVVYLLKKGNESAIEAGENLNFLETLKRGFDLTRQSFTRKEKEAPAPTQISWDNAEYSNERPSNDEMISSYSGQITPFPTLKTKKDRGMFYVGRNNARFYN